jgi:hypothetical protein
MTVLAWQDQHCAICGAWDASVEDHCHLTGLFRGYLCRGCNVSEGVRGDAPFWQYRERPPAVIVGETWVYFGGWGNQNGAEPQGWVIDFLGPHPTDPFLQVFYLASAARLRPPRRW